MVVISAITGDDELSMQHLLGRNFDISISITIGMQTD